MKILAAFLLMPVLLTGCAPAHSPFEGNILKAELQPYFNRPESIDYAAVRKFVLATSCLKCHSLDGDFADADAISYSANLTNYQTLFNRFTPVIVKGNPTESKIFQSVAINQTMPRARDGYDPLDSLRLKLLRLWILNCAVEHADATADEALVVDPDNPEKVRHCN